MTVAGKLKAMPVMSVLEHLTIMETLYPVSTFRELSNAKRNTITASS